MKFLDAINSVITADSYIMCNFLLGVSILFIFLRLIRTYKTEIAVNNNNNNESKREISFTLALAATTGTFVGIDLLWEFLYVYPVYYQTAFEIVNLLYYIGYITLPYVWFFYTLHVYRKIYKTVSFILPTAIPFIINFVLVVMTIVDNSTLWAIGDASHRYVRGELAGFSTLVNFVYYLNPIVEFSYLYFIKKKPIKAGYYTTLAFTIIPAVGLFLYRFVLTSEQVSTFPFQNFSSFVGLIFAYFFIVEEINKQNTFEVIKGKDIIDILVSQYSYVFYVDVATGKITPYGHTEYFNDRVKPFFEKEDLTIDQAFEYYVKTIVYEDDREKVFREGNFKKIVENLEHQKSFELIYRIVKNDAPEYREMVFVKVDEDDKEPTAFAMGILEKNEEIILNYISAELIDIYSSLVFIDLDHAMVKPIKISNEIGATRNKNIPYNEIFKKISSLVDDDYIEQTKYVESPDAIRELLKDVDSRELTFELRGMKYALRRSEWKVLERRDGVPTLVLATVRDMDDDLAKRMQLAKIIETQNSELSIAKARADAASDAKSKFLFNMSHDIRTPMNAILGYTNMADKCIDDPEKVKDYLDKIDIAGQHLLTLINEVLDMSRIETGNLEITSDPVNVISKATEIAGICKELADKKNIELGIITKNVHNPNVFADVLHVNQIITNVISNAIKYTNEGGKVLYTIEQTNLDIDKNKVWFKFTVSDNGIGMKPEFLKTIFENFARENNTTLSGVEGTGLGMSIVKQLVDILGGTIHIDSTVGIGTKVCIELPFDLQNTTENQVATNTQSTLITLSGRRILLVEDNAMNREIATFILEDLDAEIEEADDGDIAVEKLKDKGEDYYDFVLMDIQMPRMDGYKATQAIRKFNKKTPIIAMTANAFEEDKRKALAVGMNAHVAKPVETEVLLETLSTILE